MFALLIAVGVLFLAVLASAVLDPRSSGGDSDDYESMRDEISLSL